ncbi:Rap1a/Tai family immunity protein [Stenotrophomonas sp. LARHCG68]
MPSQVHDPSLRRLFSSSYGQAYILGIADQTQGSRWCTRTGHLPHELSDRVYTYLSELPKARLNENAGPLVSDALRRSFSCQQDFPRR